MKYSIKRFLFSSFRELFIHHHSSLEFRAKLIAVVISADEDYDISELDNVKQISLEIYKDDNDRAEALQVTTQEYVEKVRSNNGLDIDSLIFDIVKELKTVPRYAKKIDVDYLENLIEYAHDPDTITYQLRIVEMLGRLKKEYLQKL